MDLNCNCMGVATAAKVPVKRYNLLVPDIYPVVEPDVHKPLSSSVERKIKKLSEYLERNEHRAPKVISSTCCVYSGGWSGAAARLTGPPRPASCCTPRSHRRPHDRACV